MSEILEYLWEEQSNLRQRTGDTDFQKEEGRVCQPEEPRVQAGHWFLFFFAFFKLLWGVGDHHVGRNIVTIICRAEAVPVIIA